MIKIKIKKIIFELGLAPIFERINFFREKIKNKKKNKNFKEENPNVILPPDFYIYETFTLDYNKYYKGGKETAAWLWSYLKDYVDANGIAILDWGCGPGRVIRHLPLVIGENNTYYGSDYNEEYVSWCQKNINNVVFKKNKLVPPLNFESSSLNIIYGISIFTHLSEKMHDLWMLELKRVLKKGGLLFVTTHGNSTKQKLSKKEQIEFDKGNLVVNSFKKEGNRLFTAYHPYDFFRDLCERNNFKILRHIPGEVVNGKPLQDVWILCLE